MFTILLTNISNASNNTKCVSLSNQQCEIQTTLINLHNNEYSQEYTTIHVGSCNTVNDLSNKVCLPNKVKYLNIHAINMDTGKTASKIITKDISCKCNCKFDGRKCKSNKSGIGINVGASVRNIIYVKKNITEILLHVVVKMETI